MHPKPHLFASSRYFSTMATPPHKFQLDRSLFNASMYSEIRDFWYDGLPVDRAASSMALLSRWWGIGATNEERSAFDEECRTRFGRILESIGPAHLSLPPFEDHERDTADAEMRDVTDAPAVKLEQTSNK